jgi:RNA polymerase sigma factor (sigma-70 family)
MVFRLNNNQAPQSITDGNLIITKVKSGDTHFLNTLYKENREAFIAWIMQRYQMNEEDAIDLFQKAYTQFYFNIKNEKLTELTCSVKTYLISVGRNLARERFRELQSSHTTYQETIQPEVAIDNSLLDAETHVHQRELVRKILNKIGDPCKTLMELIFIKGYSADAVVDEMGYSDERVVRKRKSLCLKQMRELLIKNSELV